MWDGNEITSRLSSWQQYQCEYSPWESSRSHSKVQNRTRSHSPIKNIVNYPSAADLRKSDSCQDNILDSQENNLSLKQKCDELRRQYRKERKVWIQEKEQHLKEIAELKAGENRGILLELKAVLEVIQREQRREEKKWTDFLLQFLSDRCGWGTEETELKQYVPKIEAKLSKTCANKSIPDIPKGTRKGKRERRRLQEDTRTASMELQRQLENNERNWNVEKMELLERFDSERKEWECQWKIMQKKIEELYQEVRLRREKNLNGEEEKIEKKMLQFSMPFSQPQPMELSNIERTSQQNAMVNTKTEKSRILLNDYHSSNKEKTLELKMPHQKHDVCDNESEKWLAQRMSKTENDTLNDALKEIARVSEELCKYQEEIRTKSNSKKIVPGTAASEYKRNPYPKTVRNHTCSNMSTNKQKDCLNSSKHMHEALFNKATSQGGLSGAAPDPAFPPLSFSWHLPNSIFPDINKSTAIKDNHGFTASKERFEIADLDNSNDRLCPVQWLCEIGGLEDINLTESLFNSFTDNKSLTPDMNRQNTSMAQNGGFLSNSLYPDMILLEDSTSDFGHNYSSTRNNGTLAAKIDEFNRVVFKTGKGNAVFHEPSMDMDMVLDVLDTDEKSSIVPLSERPANPVTEVIKSSCSNGSFNSTKIMKGTIQEQQHTNGPQTTKSYKNMLLEHNWKQINLSGRPRSADSRSNYGVVEKLLKSYESKAAVPFCNSKQTLNKWTQSDFLLTDNSPETLTQCVEMLHLEETTKVLQNDIHWQPAQGAMSLKLPEISLTSSSSEKGFSRPARPANRRPPSRWASARSPSMPAAVRRATH